MKKMITICSLLISQLSFAAIANSKLEVRHLELIETAIAENCGAFSSLEQISLKEKVIKVDQGIHDIKYTTVLTGLSRLDQNIFDRYVITVESDFADMYDHNTKNWGVYSVNSVSCVQE